ncbi:putative, Na(+) H(+) antiporter subunit B [Enhygromyxa salina]|uniref:Putative, Na(+) H(+) antiporter subunit B n=1 Tax=Enhygromyxa salina TaxID=215803 RepID=A0A0C2CX22_9BACT|nr:Na(+)/H(+) antiporter subunit B [Enhygromyxa salina]KIG12402.1 putative, Na(+) H(+) antiporter subunit B [Enhygromyxa salina]
MAANNQPESGGEQMSQQTLLRVIAKMTIPFILTFGCYVILHGELGPGGGFQGGVIVAAAFILYGLVFGADELRRRIPTSIIDACMALGALLYAGVGLACVLRGGTFLDYGMLKPDHAGDGEALGMSLVEYGVGLTVASVMVTIYLMISERRATLRKGEVS